MVRFKNFECTINVGHVPLPEYTSPDDAADREGPIPTAIVYVQSEEGKAFSIRLKVLDDVGLYANSVDMYLSLDGATLKRIWNVEVHKHCFVRGFIHPNSEGRTMMREFLFSKLDVLEETRDPENNGDINSLGEITVSLRRYQRAGAVLPNPNNETKNPALPSIKSVPEKDLKGRDINQSVGFSTPKPTKQGLRNVLGHCVDAPSSPPYAVIKFRYRTERALKGLGLIPRTPLPSLSPEPEAGNDDDDTNRRSIEEMTRKELEAEVLRWRNSRTKAEAEKVVVKRERSDSTPAPKKTKKPKVVDLTGDSD